MSLITLSPNASGTGSLTIAAPNTNTNQTLTLPDNTGTILTTATGGIPINGPAFSAYRATTAQSVSVNTWTKAQLNAEDFDTANCFDSTTNYRFTPTVAGYYHISCEIRPDSSSAFGTGILTGLYKNGSIYRASSVDMTTATHASSPCLSVLVYMNGSTDYLELYGYCVAGAGMSFGTTYNSTFMSGALVRAA